ncbi:MAG: NAD(P)H-hydrate dehydratase [Bacteroidales bacterium]|nr:NAD(P)H-hydrate dehydratase [Bacteroidales bacterium]
MKKFFPIYDIKAIDRRTTELQGIEYIQLIDRAARALCDWVTDHYTRRKVVVLAGPGNNGADGICLAILLREREWLVDLHTYTGYKGRRGENNEACLRQLSDTDIEYDENEAAPSLAPGCLVIDALFGTGLKRDLEGPAAQVARFVNESKCEIVSIDIPSGIGNEDNYLKMTDRQIIRATHTVTFQFPKMAFFLPELHPYIGRWHVLDIHLAPLAIEEAPTFMYYSDNTEAAALLRPRSRFAHKGVMGHALIFAGSEGMSGAAILASKAALRTGCGLVTTATAPASYVPLQVAVPEAMVITPHSERRDIITWDDRMNIERASAIAIGPGLGRDPYARELLRMVLKTYGERVPIVIDADGLYALRPLLDEGVELPPNVILTPHPGELDRLTEPHTQAVERVDAACLLAIRHKAAVVLKGAFTMTALPDGRRVFNTTGNSGMATAGSGDALTGIIVSLLAQGYSAERAALLGVALHAAAGDAAAAALTEEAMTSADIVAHIPDAFKTLKGKQ